MENRMFEHAIFPSSASRQSRSLMHRRSLLIGAGAAGMVLGTAMGRAYTQIATAPDHSLRIAPRRHAALHVHAEAYRHPVVSQPQYGRYRSDAKLVCGTVRLLDRRAGERCS